MLQAGRAGAGTGHGSSAHRPRDDRRQPQPRALKNKYTYSVTVCVMSSRLAKSTGILLVRVRLCQTEMLLDDAELLTLHVSVSTT